MKYVRNISRIIIGIIFIFSGFVKVVDPLGYSIKFLEYFEAMGLTFMSGGATVFAFLMAAAELLLGIALFFNLLPKFTAWLLLLFMVMFTPLTFWLAITNAVTDCGCFGDALVLTNWETFIKNVIIDVFVAIIFIQKAKFKPIFNLFFQLCFAVIFIIVVFALEFYCYIKLPIIDFRPYHIGANLKEGMLIPEKEKNNLPIYQTYLSYSKDGVERQFKLDKNNIIDVENNNTYVFSDFAKEWTFVKSESKLIKEGYLPPIHDFTITPIYIEGYSEETNDDIFIDYNDYSYCYTKDGIIQPFQINELPDSSWKFVDIINLNNDIDLDINNIKIKYLLPDTVTEEEFTLKNLPPIGSTFIKTNDYIIHNDNYKTKYGENIVDDVLNSRKYTFLVVSTKLSDMNSKYIKDLVELQKYCNKYNYDFYLLTSSTDLDIANFIKDHNINFNFYSTDETTLKTIIRSNPGVLLIKEAVVLNKWADKDISKIYKIDNDLNANALTCQQKYKDILLYISSTLLMFLFMALAYMFYKYLKDKKYII